MSLFDFFKGKDSNSETSQAESQQEEIIQEEKQDMIEGVEGLSSTTVKEVMIPRIDVDFIPSDCEKNELIEKIIASGHSRFPVYSESTDNVIGVLYVKDLLKFIANNEEIDITKIVRKPYFVPESKIIHSLLREFKRRHLHIAIAIDEYGGISGIVTMEDIIEEIVGDINDEHDDKDQSYKKISDDMYEFNGRFELEGVEEIMGIRFDEETEQLTIGGYVFNLFERLPVVGDTIEDQNCLYEVIKMDGASIGALKVTLLSSSSDEEDFD